MRPVVMCGIPRSGSTLVWQVLSEVLPGPIPQTHPAAWERDGESVAVVTIRDPHDVAASLYRVRISRGGVGVGGEEGLANVLKQVQIYFGAVPRVLESPHLLLRYEEFVYDRDVIWRAIWDSFGVEVLPPERERIERKFSLEANQKRAAKLRDFNEVGEHHIHGDHIGPVDPGSWKWELPVETWERVRGVCGPIADEWDYAH